MRFVKEENYLRLIKIAALGQLFIKLAHQKQHKRSIKRGILCKLYAMQYVYIAPALTVVAYPIVYVY